ncbi:MAG: shikimate kinase [Lachnospiraceae bacterium]|nr:shikimate kinase [Lachnospiraceae bacterium]
MENIVLIGFMGAGKTTIGRELAKHLSVPMIDSDALIEQKAQMSVSAMFEEKGEAYFRRMETDVLKELLDQKEPMILSCGGGLPMREENRILLKQIGAVVFLEVSPETVANRLKGDKTRPLLQGADAKNRIERLLEERKERYQQAADLCICVDGKAPETICSEILKKIEKNT